MRRKVLSSRRRDDLVHHTVDFHSVNMVRGKRVVQVVDEGNDAGEREREKEKEEEKEYRGETVMKIRGGGRVYDRVQVRLSV